MAVTLVTALARQLQTRRHARRDVHGLLPFELRRMEQSFS
jgi:hypothetical protein